MWREEGRASWARDVGMESSRKCNCCTKAKEHKTVGAGIPSRWGMGLKVRPKIVARFTISGCIVRILGRGRAARAHNSLKRLGITITVGIEFGLAARPAKRLRRGEHNEMPAGCTRCCNRGTNGRAHTDEPIRTSNRRTRDGGRKALEA